MRKAAGFAINELYGRTNESKDTGDEESMNENDSESDRLVEIQG